MQVWGRIMQGHKTLRQMTLDLPEDNLPLVTRVKLRIDDMVMEMDLPRPIWFHQNEKDIMDFGRTDFRQDHFIEHIPFTCFEVELIDEEDDALGM